MGGVSESRGGAGHRFAMTVHVERRSRISMRSGRRGHGNEVQEV